MFGGIGGTAGATAASTATAFTSAMGHGVTEALNDGADIDEARVYGMITGAAEAGSEFMFGGLGKASKAVGISKGAFDDVIAKTHKSKWRRLRRGCIRIYKCVR